MRTLAVLLHKEFAQIVRDRFMLREIIMIPIVQLLILSSAATFEVRTARLFVVDQDHTPASRAIVDRLRASGRFVIADASPSLEAADEALLTRRADLILTLPEGLDRELTRAGHGRVQLVLNAEDGAAAGVTHAYAARIIQRYAGERGATVRPAADMPATRPARAGPVVDVRTRGLYNPQLDYRDYMVPGILVQLVTVIGTLLTAMNIVREKEIGTLEQLNVTPLGRGTFVAAKLIPLWMIALVELALGLVVAKLVFDTPMVGSITLIFFAAAVYLVAALGIGLWVSTIAHTQQQAMFVTFFIIMVYLLMSGLFTPVRSMPDWAQWIAEANPLKHFIHLMRAVMLKGAGFMDVAREIVIMAGLGVGVLLLAWRQQQRVA